MGEEIPSTIPKIKRQFQNSPGKRQRNAYSRGNARETQKYLVNFFLFFFTV